MSFRTNRRTLKPFPVIRRKGRTLEQIFDDLRFRGRYLDQVTWLKDHGFAYFDQHTTPDDYIWETYMDNFGNVVKIKIARPSDVKMEDATIVDAQYIPVPEYIPGRES